MREDTPVFCSRILISTAIYRTYIAVKCPHPTDVFYQYLNVGRGLAPPTVSPEARFGVPFNIRPRWINLAL
jgi:hypothetical protein